MFVAGIFLGLFPGEFLGGAGVLLAFLAMAGALLKWMRDMIVGDLVVVLSSAFSLIVGGGFFIGCVLGLIGGFMGLYEYSRPTPTKQKGLASKRPVGLILSLVAAMILLVNGALLTIIGREFILTGSSLLATLLAGMSFMFGVMVLLGSVYVWRRHTPRGGWLILLFSLLSLCIGGGWLVGLILGTLGGILILTGRENT